MVYGAHSPVVSRDDSTLYVSSMHDNRIRAVDLGCTPGITTGSVSVFYHGEGRTGSLIDLLLDRPGAMLLCDNGLMLIADTNNERIVSINEGVLSVVLKDVGRVDSLVHASGVGEFYFANSNVKGVYKGVGSRVRQPVSKKPRHVQLPLDLMSMMQKTDSMDVVVKLCNGHSVFAHSFILQARSTFFATALGGVWANGANGAKDGKSPTHGKDATGSTASKGRATDTHKRVVCMEDFSVEAFEVCLYWAYGGSVPPFSEICQPHTLAWGVEQACGVMKCACFLNMLEVQTRVVDLFRSELTPVTIPHVLKCLYDMDEHMVSEDLLASATQYLHNNISAIAQLHSDWTSYDFNSKLTTVMCKCLTTHVSARP